MMHQQICECGQFDCAADHGAFYTSIRNDSGSYRLMLGPFSTHEAALNAVSLTQQLADKADPRAHWYSYGTCRTDGTIGPLFRPCLHCGEVKHVHQQHDCTGKR